MPSIELVKIKIRRGSDAQRQRVVLEQGELAYTIDTKRVFVGDGVLSGGNVIGSIVHNPLQAAGSRIGITGAQRGDVVSENSLMYQLTGTDYSTLSCWGNISTKVNNVSIEYNASNQLSVKDGGITMAKLSSYGFVGPGLQQTYAGFAPVYDDATIGLNGSNQLYVKNSAINEARIASTIAGDGIQGGAGTKLSVKAEPTQFGFIGGYLTLTGAPVSNITFDQIPGSLIGDGLELDSGTSSIIADIQSVDATLTKTGHTIGLTNLGGGATKLLAQVTTDSYGRVTSNTSSIATTFSLSAKPGMTDNYPLISAFNGYPGQVTNGRLTDIELTTMTVLSSNGSTSVALSLSSAGFITFNNTNAVDGQIVDRFAIPVFSY